jgi:hypothetical protein
VIATSPYLSPYPFLSLSLYTMNIIVPKNSAVTTPAPVYTTIHGMKTYCETGESAELMGDPYFPARIHTGEYYSIQLETITEYVYLLSMRYFEPIEFENSFIQLTIEL